MFVYLSNGVILHQLKHKVMLSLVSVILTVIGTVQCLHVHKPSEEHL